MRALIIIYDNASHIHWFPLGAAYVASWMREREGFSVSVFHQDRNHIPDEVITAHLDQTHYDVVALGFCGGYYQYRKAKAISAAVNASKNRPHFQYILGGHGPAADPGHFTEVMGCDRVVVGDYEGETEIDQIPEPAYDLFPMSYYRLVRFANTGPADFVMPVITSRGCPYRCSFCYRMTGGIRLRSVEGIAAGLERLNRDYKINYVYFEDELTMVSAKRMAALCDMIDRLPFRMRWACSGRLNIVTPEMLERMKSTGCVFINYGVEALDDDVLRQMNKKLTVEQIHRSVAATVQCGISPGLNVMWGNPGDTLRSLYDAVEFVNRYSDNAQLRTIRPVTPYPGCDLFARAVAEGKLEGTADFYAKHRNSDLATVQWTGLPDDEFHQHLERANNMLVRGYYMRECRDVEARHRRLYREGDVGFRGLRQT